MAAMSQASDAAADVPPHLDPAVLNTAIDLLAPALEILQRFHHRNKNQHRSSKWWAQADMLRRHVRKMRAELDGGLPEAERLARLRARGKNWKAKLNRREGGGGSEEGELNAVVNTRAEYLRWKLGPGAYLAFTQLSADRQFAHLGLMLLGVLAQVDKAVAPFAPSPSGDAAEPGPALELAGKPGRSSTLEPAAMNPDTDMGIAVSRDEMVMLSIEPADKTSTPMSVPTSSTSAPEPELATTEMRAASLPGRLAPQQRQGRQSTSRSATSPTQPPPAAAAARTEPASPAPDKSPPVPSVSDRQRKKKRRAASDEFDDIFSSLDHRKTTTTTTTTAAINNSNNNNHKDERKTQKHKRQNGEEQDGREEQKQGEQEEEPERKAKPPQPPPKKKKKKKQKKAGDEFDDIFGGLL